MRNLFAGLVLITVASFQTLAVSIENYVYVAGNRFDTSVMTSAQYIDNYLYQDEDTTSSWLATIAPSINYQLDEEGYALAFVAEGNIGFYQENSDDNFADFSGGAAYRWKFAEDQRLNLNANWATITESRGTGLSEGMAELIKEPDEKQQYTFMAGYEYGSPGSRMLLKFNAGVGALDYTTREEITSVNDYDFSFVKGRIDYQYSGKTYLTLVADYRDVSYDVDKTRDSEEYVYLAGVRWETTGLTTGHAMLGYYEKDIEQSYDGTSWDVQVDWYVKTYSKFMLSSGRKLEESYDLSAEFIRDDYLSLQWQHFWRDDVLTDAKLGWQNERFFSDLGDRDQATISATVDWRYQYKSYIAGILMFGWEDQDDDDDMRDYEQFVAGLGVEFDL